MINTQQPERAGHRQRRLGGLLSLLASLIWLVQAWVIAWVLAALLSGTDVAPVQASLLFVGASLLRSVLNKIAQGVLSSAAETEISALRDELILIEAKTAKQSGFGGAGVRSVLATEKLEALRPYLLRYEPARMRVMVIPLMIVAITAWHSWAAAVVLLAAGPLIPVFMALVGWAAKEASARQMIEIGSLNDLLSDRLSALSDLKLVGSGTQVINGFADASESLRNRTMGVLRIAFLSSTVLELFAALGVAMIAVWVGFALLGEISWGTWGMPLSPFAGVFLLLLAPDYFQPLRDLAAAWHDKAAADAVYQEMKAWRSDPREVIIGTGGHSSPALFEGVSTRGLTLQHDDRTLVYPDFDLVPGEGVALTGPSGVGKSSLLRLVAGLDRPTSGVVAFGSSSLSADNADAWRASIGWIPQAPRFLGQSLRYNIGFGAKLNEEVIAATHVAPVIKTLPSGQLTRLGESGAGLSGGEARRVMLARALHRNPRLLLADEPTADLDEATAQDIINGLLHFLSCGGTLIAATHDPRLISQMQRQVRLEAKI